MKCCLVGGLLLGLTRAATGQGGVSGGAREILSIGFANGALPREIKAPSSGLVVVEKNGVQMLRASTAAEFRLQLPEQLPNSFTLEFDLVAKECFCAPKDLRFEGTAGSSQSDVYAEVQWSPMDQAVVGGGLRNPSPFTATTPPSLSETLRGQLARIVVGVEGNVIKLYTNGTRLYSVSDRQFARTRVLRVSLGGQDEEDNGVYLARIRVAEGTVTATSAIAQNPSGRFSPTGRESAPPPPQPPPPPPPPPAPAPSEPPKGVAGVLAQVDAQGKVTVSWQTVEGATSYFVARWLVGDNVCCGNTSPPEGIAALTWQDAVLPRGGTYGYRVYATTASAIYSGETTVVYQPSALIASVSPVVLPQTESTLAPITLKPPVPRTIKLAGLTGTGVVGSSPSPRTIALAAFTASAGFRAQTLVPRAIPLGEVTAVGTAKSSVKVVTGSVAPPSRTITVGGITASGGFRVIVVSPRAIPLAVITAKGSGVGAVVQPRTIDLVGVTSVGSAKTLIKNP